MMYQIQYRLPEESWQDYGWPVPVLRADYVAAQCYAAHPDCEIRRVQAVEATWEDRQRIAIEQGPGGDHDQPYVYQAPGARARDAWVRLLARWRRGEFEEDAA